MNKVVHLGNRARRKSISMGLKVRKKEPMYYSPASYQESLGIWSHAVMDGHQKWLCSIIRLFKSQTLIGT